MAATKSKIRLWRVEDPPLEDRTTSKIQVEDPPLEDRTTSKIQVEDPPLEGRNTRNKTNLS
jgi:hypothetical protein